MRKSAAITLNSDPYEPALWEWWKSCRAVPPWMDSSAFHGLHGSTKPECPSAVSHMRRQSLWVRGRSTLRVPDDNETEMHIA